MAHQRTFDYDFTDISCAGEIIGLEPLNNLVHKSSSGTYEISEHDPLIINLAIDGKVEVVELKLKK